MEYEKKEQSDAEKRVRALTKLYYSNPKVQQALLDFAQSREVVPRYFEGFGKRPDTIQYPSDIMGLVNKGATSFHASEEIWQDPLKISSEMSSEEFADIRKSWDLLIDIDSKYLDYSKIAAKLMVEALEMHGVKNYGIKFSGSKGFHIIVSGNSFPGEYDGKEMRRMFPEWPRAIAEYLVNTIRPRYNKIIAEQDINFEAVEKRMNLSKEDITEVVCPQCNRPAQKRAMVTLECPDCRTLIQRKDMTVTKRKLKCINDKCTGMFEVVKEDSYFFCEYCNLSNISKVNNDDGNKVVYSKEARKDSYSESFIEGIAGNKLAGLDMVLVAPRHLFRMPYSLHEKTALASVVITKEQIDGFTPKDANPLNLNIRPFLPVNDKGEATRLLSAALSWKKQHQTEEEKMEKKKYSGKEYAPVNMEGVTEEMFPPAIKKLLKGLVDGKKRGLFILITFLRSCGFSYEYVDKTVREWNKKNDQPLKEGYIRSQLDWHFKQKKKILPPNYDNDSFYKDLGLISEKQKVKNPLVEVLFKLKPREKN